MVFSKIIIQKYNKVALKLLCNLLLLFFHTACNFPGNMQPFNMSLLLQNTEPGALHSAPYTWGSLMCGLQHLLHLFLRGN